MRIEFLTPEAMLLNYQRKGIELPKRATAPWPIDCASDLDDSPESNTINLL